MDITGDPGEDCRLDAVQTEGTSKGCDSCPQSEAFQWSEIIFYISLCLNCILGPILDSFRVWAFQNPITAHTKST